MPRPTTTTTSSSSIAAAGAPAPDLSLRAGMILAWMLLVEVLHSKVDEIRMGAAYSGIIQRAGRVAWLGSLVFFSINSAGRKVVFGILWIICATKVAQRIAFTEVWKRSHANVGKDAAVLTSSACYMAHNRPAGGDHLDVEHGTRNNESLMKKCKYIVMGENRLKKKATADGYDEFTDNDITSNDDIVTVGKVWELAESDRLFALYDKNQRSKRLCLSFALFKLLRRRFEHLPAMPEQEARDCRTLLLDGLYGESKEAEALFQVMNDEVKFLCEYYHSFIPVVFASPFFLVANYVLVPIVVVVLCLMSTVLCGN
ncbi:hypothetical protein BS78_10G016900 [Paspalum vaginatum]|nr:hypothetical protein BS78_10G016900 [Paspalum vaginatum]